MEADVFFGWKQDTHWSDVFWALLVDYHPYVSVEGAVGFHLELGGFFKVDWKTKFSLVDLSAGIQLFIADDFLHFCYMAYYKVNFLELNTKIA